MANILVVDDAQIMQANLTKLFEQLGHNVVATASHGKEALETYQLYKPDLVTMDITMPAIDGIADGIEAVEAIKKIDFNAKIIMITSHGEENKVIRAIQKGAKNYILKPINIDKLKEVLDKVLA
jgi:two-component system chemotaxis response regulator CheY